MRRPPYMKVIPRKVSRLKPKTSRMFERASKNPYHAYNAYNTALALSAYGDHQMIGDLFGDIMGAVVGKDNWNARPDWMKNIKIKPDPAAILKKAATVVPPKQVGNLVRTAADYGMNMFYRTPAGNVPMTGDMVEGAYSGYPAFAVTKNALANIPIWVYVGGGGLILYLLMQTRR